MAAMAPMLLLLLPLLMVAAAAAGQEETHIKVYWHDVMSGPDPTMVPVAQAAVTNASKTFFGLVAVIDDPLTEGPELNSSRLVGRAQGMYISAGKHTTALLMNMVFVFQAGPYNGSTVAIMGRNAVGETVREMSVIGGSGVFRWARGYAQATTHTFDRAHTIVHYNLFITH